MKKIGKKGWIGIGVVAVIIIAWMLMRGGKKEETISFETAKVENTSIHTSITATGTIEPVLQLDREERAGDCRAGSHEPDQ